jgi:Zn ribbon nucleic-acid-binding protein
MDPPHRPHNNWQAVIHVHCPACRRCVRMDPGFVAGKVHRLRCMRCGHRGAEVRVSHTAEKAGRENVIPINRKPFP